MKWFNVQDELPQDEVRVLCFHEPSKNYFISYRTKDCLSGEPKWFNGDMPTHWQELTVPVINEDEEEWKQKELTRKHEDNDNWDEDLPLDEIDPYELDENGW